MRSIVRILVMVYILSSTVSCRTAPEASNMKQAQEIESVLRRLLADQRKAIEKDAPFVYETDVFAGGVITSGPSRVVIGKWTVNILGETAKARIEKRFGSSGRFESEVIEVEMLFQDGSVVVRDWLAYQGRGSIN